MSIRISKFTPNEIAVMRALYSRNKPSTIGEVAQAITGRREKWCSSRYRITQTTLATLVQRGHVKRNENGRNLEFTPAKSLRQFLQDELIEVGAILFGKLPRGFKTAVEELSKKFT